MNSFLEELPFHTFINMEIHTDDLYCLLFGILANKSGRKSINRTNKTLIANPQLLDILEVSI